MNQRVLLGGAAAAVALGVGVAIFLNRGDDGEKTAAGSADDNAQVTAPDRDDPAAPVRARVPGRATSDDVEAHDPAGDKYVETIEENGSRRRDHRDEPEERLRPPLPHSSKSPVSSKVVDTAVISIDEDGNLTALELRPKAGGIDEAAVEPALECIRGSAGSLKAQVEHDPVESATIGLTVHPRRRAQ